MNYYIYHIKAKPARHEMIIALLAELLPFDAFEEKDEEIAAYLQKGISAEQVEAQIKELSGQFKFEYRLEVLPDRNWNAEWEAAFEPVAVEQFCLVRADFHSPDPAMEHEIVINPKMAFGTGHHETTYMMIKMMAGLDFSQKKVLDYGCGTGILAILASKLGAQEIDAVDIEEAAYENTIENAQVNNVYNIRAIHGDLQAVVDDSFDIILANINRNVILASLAELKYKLNKRGALLISGILRSDEKHIVEAAKKNKFTVDSRLEKGEWLCMKLLP